MAVGNKIKWEEADFKWELSPKDGTKPRYTWDDVKFLEEIIAVGDSLQSAIRALDPEKKKRFIKLICKVKGIETYSGQKTIRDDIEVKAEDIELVIKEVLGIGLTVENIHV
tara:strand:- start:16 stop:348 length:333 start_codon:yes stop_codon:yes gene_type:complete